MNKGLLFVTLTLLAGCGFVPRKVPLDDPDVQQLLKASQSFNREDFGFSPLPTDPTTDVRLENSSKGTYDKMLHIYGSTSRTIAFRKTKSGYKWIHEQEGFLGPKFYDSPDGHLQEILYLTYETEPLSGSTPHELKISYFGTDSRISGKSDLTLKDILPILIEWGYRKKG